MNNYNALLTIPPTILALVGGMCIYLYREKFGGFFVVDLTSRLDRKIPFYPIWVWPYVFLFFPSIVLLAFSIDSFQDYFLVLISFSVVLAVQIVVSLVVKVSVPHEWRSFESKCVSSRFLKFVHSFDKGGNCFPSLHVAIGTLAAVHASAAVHAPLGAVTHYSWVLPGLIGLSAVFLKQHLIVDVIAGVLLGIVGGGVYWIMTVCVGQSN